MATCHRKIGVIGFPFENAQCISGVHLGPEAVRVHGLVEALRDLGHEVKDYGDLDLNKIILDDDPPVGKVNNPRTVGAANKVLSDAVKGVVSSGKICLNVGGDHSMSIGSIYGHALENPNIAVIWLDAHADINTPLTTLNGDIHGMPLAFLLKEMKKYMTDVPGFEWMKPCINAKNIAYIGLRDMKTPELYLISEFGIPCYSIHEVDKFGIGSVFKKAMANVDPDENKAIHVNFDIDCLDPSIANSTGYPEDGGLTLRECLYIAEEIAETGRLSVLDVVEVNPLLGSEKEKNQTIKSALKIIMAFFGKKRTGNIPPGFSFPLPCP